MAQTVDKVIIGTRESKLAMWQAKFAHRLLSESTDKTIATFEIKGMTTKGDKDQNTSLSKFSDKGIFTKELDVALLESTIDCAVHCVKDLPTTFHHDLGIASYLKRGLKNDVVLIDKTRHPNAKSINDLPNNSIIGTGSLRRQSLLKSFKFDNNICIKGIRGNLNTRLNKLVVQNLYDAIILAHIGVERLGWMMHENQIKNNKDEVDQNALKINVIPLSMSSFPYAIGQGALAIMCREKDIQQQSKIYQILKGLNNFHSEMVCKMERNLLRVLEGGCKVPIATRCDIFRQCKCCGLWNSIERKKCQACYQSMGNNQKNAVVNFNLYGLVLSQDGNTKIESKESRLITINNYDLSKLNIREHQQYKEIVGLCIEIGESVANKLKSQGAQEIINEIKQEALKEVNSKSK